MENYHDMAPPSAIFFDIDGTLCRYEETVTLKTRECFAQLHKGGHKLFLCTGRSPADISKDIYSLGFDGVISCMGAIVCVGNHELRHRFIPRDMLLKTVKALIDQKIPALILGKNEVLRTEYMVPSQLETGVVRRLDDLYRNEVLAYISSLDMEYKSVDSLGNLKTLIEEHSDLVEYSPQNGQTRLHGVNKASGISLVLSLPEFNGMRSYAIGDSQNDLEMLKSVDVSIAMGDSPEEVKCAADWCTLTVEEEGVFHAMKHFYLI